MKALCLLVAATVVALPAGANDLDCAADVVGLCTPGTSIVVDTLIEEEVIQEDDGTSYVTTTTETTTTTTVTNIDSGDILDPNNGYVGNTKSGDMSYDWGGEGPASMPTGSSCRGIKDSGRCAGITGTYARTTKSGVKNVGTTYIQTIEKPDEVTSGNNGGRTTYSIDVDRNDAADDVYIHMTGRHADGTTAFTGTDWLAVSGDDAGFATYTGGFDFAHDLTEITVEIGGLNQGILGSYALFDNVSINVIMNAIDIMIQQHIETTTLFVAIDLPEEESLIVDIIEDILDNNVVEISDEGDITITPIIEIDDTPEIVEITYEAVEIEIEDLAAPIEIASLDATTSEETMMEVEVVVEEVEQAFEEISEPEPEASVEPEPETKPEPEPEPEVEPETEPEPTEKVVEEAQEEEVVVEKKQTKSNEVKQAAKEKVAKKLIKAMGNNRYSNENQLKTLLVMQVLAGNSKSFFDQQQMIQEPEGFFTDAQLTDQLTIPNNGMASLMLFTQSTIMMDTIVNSQWKDN